MEEQTIEVLFRLLSQGNKDNLWLLVLDDVKEPAAVQQLWKHLPAQTGHIIITSSKPLAEWAAAGVTFTNTIELEPWTDDELVDYWKQAAVVDGAAPPAAAALTSARLVELAGHVGRLPVTWRILAGVAATLEPSQVEAILAAVAARDDAAAGGSNAFAVLIAAVRAQLDLGQGEAAQELRLCRQMLDILSLVPVTGLPPNLPRQAKAERLGLDSQSAAMHACVCMRACPPGVPQRAFQRPEEVVAELRKNDQKAALYMDHYVKVRRTMCCAGARGHGGEHGPLRLS